MKSKLCTLILVFIISSCSSSVAPVGSGADFSAFSTQPTARELVLALLSASYGPNSSSKLKGRKGLLLKWALRTLASTKGVYSQEGILVEEKGTRTCPGGGTVPWSNTDKGSSERLQATLVDCATTIEVAGATYSETLSGTLTGDYTSSDSSDTLTYKANISGSGDIGFAVDCEFRTTWTSEARSNTGLCTFRDGSGNKIEGTAEDFLENGVFSIF